MEEASRYFLANEISVIEGEADIETQKIGVNKKFCEMQQMDDGDSNHCF